MDRRAHETCCRSELTLDTSTETRARTSGLARATGRGRAPVAVIECVRDGVCVALSLFCLPFVVSRTRSNRDGLT